MGTLQMENLGAHSSLRQIIRIVSPRHFQPADGCRGQCQYGKHIDPTQTRGV